LSPGKALGIFLYNAMTVSLPVSGAWHDIEYNGPYGEMVMSSLFDKVRARASKSSFGSLRNS
jgi:hypothetical protein